MTAVLTEDFLGLSPRRMRGVCQAGSTPDLGWGGWQEHLSSRLVLPSQEHPFFTLHKTKKTDIAAFVKKILGEDS